MTTIRLQTARGFSMIEIVVAIAVISILASIAAPVAMRFEMRAQVAAATEEIQSIETALLASFEDQQAFPKTLDALEDEGLLSGGLSGSESILDPWGNAYTMDVSGITAQIASAGPDREGGTTDDLVLDVNAKLVARRLTLDEMETIHVALRNFEAARLIEKFENLPPRWSSTKAGTGSLELLSKLGFLPDDARFETDAWGSAYEFDGTPSDRVTSPGLSGTGGGT